MIGSLRGTLSDVAPRSSGVEVLIDVGGIGYRATVTAATAAGLGSVGSSAFLYIHTNVREDAINLFGFAARDERGCFETLIGAHGVGPSVALAVLSVLDPNALRRAVASDDVASLTRVPGIGKKTAARLLIDLKSGLEVPELDLSEGVDGALTNGSGVIVAVRAALAGLGYSGEESRQALVGLEADDEQALLRKALRTLAGSR